MKSGKVKFHFVIKNEATGENMRCYRVFNEWDASAFQFLNTIWSNGFQYAEKM